MSYDNPRKQSVMQFANAFSSPWRHSWRCSSLWRQVALSSGKDLCIWRSPWQSSSWVATQQLPCAPPLVQAAQWCLPTCINQQHPQHENSRKVQCGAHKHQCGGRNSPAPLVHDERTLKLCLGQGEGNDDHLHPSMEDVLHRASNSHSCLPLVQKWAPVP